MDYSRSSAVPRHKLPVILPDADYRLSVGEGSVPERSLKLREDRRPLVEKGWGLDESRGAGF